MKVDVTLGSTAPETGRAAADPKEHRGRCPAGHAVDDEQPNGLRHRATPSRDATELDDLDRELLNAVQWDFPLEPRPYAALGERLGIPEPEVRERIAKVKDAGVLRQLSAIFDTRALGYSSALVAAKIDPEHIDEAAAIISEHPGVSHNYKRNHAYNLWYTIAVPPGDVARRAHRRAAPRVGRARHAQAADAEALQDRREARHDRQDRGQREDRGARARASGAQGRDAGARPQRPRARDDPRRAGRPARTSSARSRQQADATRRRRSRRARRRCGRSRSASSCGASPR